MTSAWVVPLSNGRSTRTLTHDIDGVLIVIRSSEEKETTDEYLGNICIRSSGTIISLGLDTTK